MLLKQTIFCFHISNKICYLCSLKWILVFRHFARFLIWMSYFIYLLSSECISIACIPIYISNILWKFTIRKCHSRNCNHLEMFGQNCKFYEIVVAYCFMYIGLPKWTMESFTSIQQHHTTIIQRDRFNIMNFNIWNISRGTSDWRFIIPN